MNEPSIRPAARADVGTIKRIAVAAGMFSVDEVQFLDEMLDGFFDGSPEGSQWIVAEGDSGEVVAAANYAPEPFADRMWNLYFIAVDPGAQGNRVGGAMIAHVEETLKALGQDNARVLIVETSSTDQYAPAREFYAKLGYDQEARIRQFYGPDDDKVVFWKALI